MKVWWATAAVAAMIAVSGAAQGAGSQQPPPAPTLRAPPPLPLFGGLTQSAPSNRGCGDDVFCRLDAIDARLARIERALARGGGGGGGVSIEVGRHCRITECGAVALEACTTAGFQRGGPDEISHDTAVPRLLRAVCFD